ncbi:hypothetical protein MC7420_4316 [Coleofasciculus chthonoplastes PCC 7420]|uniref:Uncharacterized protein n=1 Tax=Coleofasciculus chthonoplastes PCC 7420 TaxID=118168 RepID=B4W417_9CYAN|nr:hypothetical protein [Coleofasciculus chthonoplastes]EDX71129.1 hypothetical protein MC7420_4316 [Coleofasciculus chthonoplastes PCC 7420]
MEDHKENNSSIQLHEIYGLTNELKPILPFLYQEVPIAERRNILIAYQRLLGFPAVTGQIDGSLLSWAKGGIFSYGLRDAIVNVLTIILPVIEQENHCDVREPTNYEIEKLSIAYESLSELAKSIAFSKQEEYCEFQMSKSYIDDMYYSIMMLIHSLLDESTLKEGDKAMLKFFRNLVEFALEEIKLKTFLPIPQKVSYRFTKFLSVCLKQPIIIVVPELDDSGQLKLIEQVQPLWMRHLGRTPEEQLERNKLAMAWAKARMEKIESRRNKRNQ